MDQISKYVDLRQDDFISVLSEIVSIPSVSGDATYRKHVFTMANWLSNKMTSLNIELKQHLPGTQTIQGQTIDLPPILLGRYGSDPLKKTVLVYGILI